MKFPRAVAIIALALPLPVRLGAEILDLVTATIPELQRAYDAGLAAEKVVNAYLRRIDAYDRSGPKLNAILHLNDRALAEARALDVERRKSGPRSLLHGVPILVKDNIDTVDQPTTGGALALAGQIPPHDAFVIARLRAAGAIILAKTNLDEFARGATGTSSLGGQTLNPYNLEKIPGGSSAGSAVGVAALFGWASLGTETGSSLRNPATKNSLVAFCPSAGLVSRRGVIPQSPIYDRVGPIARNVTDAAVVLEAMVGVDPGDLVTLQSLEKKPAESYVAALRPNGLNGARIGVLRQLFGSEEEDESATTLIDDAIALLQAKGATVIDPLSVDIDLWAAVRHVSSGGGGDSRAGLDYYFSTREPTFPIESLADLVASGGILGRLKKGYLRDLEEPALSDNPAYAANYADRLALRETVTALLDREQLEALVYPHETKTARTLALEVPDWGKSKGPPDDRGPGKGNTISSATGLPTIVVPVGLNTDGIGVSLEFLGRRFNETALIRLAYGYEQAAPRRQLPPTTPLLGIERMKY